MHFISDFEYRKRMRYLMKLKTLKQQLLNTGALHIDIDNVENTGFNDI